MSERKNIVMDSQILNSVQNCAYKTDLTFNQDLVPTTKGEALEEGDLLHQMFEHYNLKIKDEGTGILYDNEKFNSLLEECSSLGMRQSIAMNLDQAEVDKVIYEFNEYSKHTRMDGITILEVERPFIIELYKDDELGIFYTGKIDRYTDTPNFGPIPRDYKKAAQTRAPSSTSNQFTGYAYATWPKDANIHYVAVDKVGFQKTLPPEQRFRSYFLAYTKDMIETWKKDTIWWGKMYAFFLEEGTWPRNRTSCDKYGGCIFERHCSAGTDEGAAHVLSVDFMKGEKWDPTKPLRDKNLLSVK